MADKDQRTEQPSQRRLERARREGNIPVSREFAAGIQFAAFVAIMTQYREQWFEGAQSMTRALIRRAFERLDDERSLLRIPAELAGPTALPLLAGGGAVAAAAFAAHLLCTGGTLTPSKLKLDLSRLNPASRLSQLASRGLSQAGIALLLLVALGGVLYWLASGLWESLLVLPLRGLGPALWQAASGMDDLLWKAAALLAAFGAVDLYRQRSEWNSRLKMTKQEVRDEAKESEGDPLVKMRVRRLMRERSRRRMMQDVARATAVVVNPAHYAVAIRYAPGEMQAPKVVAKGKNYLARRIREVALRNQVPIIENPPLARALYKAAAVGQDIPAHLYRAVAEVLAYLYRLMGGRLPGG